MGAPFGAWLPVSEAIGQQMGLNLELRNAPAPVLVIDQVDKLTPNAPGVAQKLPPRQLEWEVADVKVNKSADRDSFHRRGGNSKLPMRLRYCWA